MTTRPRRGENLWIDVGDGFIGAAWYWPGEAAACSTAVVIVPAIAHEERTMSGGLAALAEALADAGLPALLMDLHGCSQSAGLLEDAEIGACWQNSIRAAVHHARATGAARVIVIGVRLGFPLAVEALAQEPLAALIAWVPVVSGKRYVRELKLLQQTDVAGSAAGTIAIGGFSIPASALECISALDLNKIEAPSASCVILRDSVEGLNAPWLKRLSERGMVVQEQISNQIHPWLFGASDQPELPHEDIEGLARWCRALNDAQAAAADTAPVRHPSRSAIEFSHRGRLIRETFVEIGPIGLTGVLSEAVDAPSGHAVRLLMSTVGPGRTFADFARDEAGRGNSSLRFDFAGFGTSGRGDTIQGGELYTDQGSNDVQAVIEHLRRAGHRQIYGVGFCAGAWSMMQAGAAPELRAAVAINVALYRQPGRVAPKLGTQTRQRLARISPRLVRNALRNGIAAHVRRAASRRREPVDWLLRLCNANVHIMLAYADLDPGLTYLTSQKIGRGREQLRRPFTLQTYTGLGHLAEGPSARTSVFQDIADFFARLDATGDHKRDPTRR